MRLATRAARRALPIALAVALAGLPAVASAADTSRPRPPRSAELRAAPDGAPVGALEDGRAGALEDLGEPTPLPGGAAQIFPANRVVALYGAPQMRATILGRLTPFEAWRQIRGESSRYRRLPGARPTVRGFELVVAIATADRGADGRYRFRQTQATIARYLRAARQANARLILDIQPGRSPFTTEVRALRRWLREPDVDLALDPEWNVGPRGVPGRTEGSVDASAVNAVSDQLASIVREYKLPQKLLVVHQFREASIRGASAIRRRPAVAPTLSFDGIGSARAKRAGYRALAEPGLFNGICLFYRLDDGLMSPSSVVALRPPADYVLYQ